MLNKFCKELSEVCDSNPLQEKWLLAPSFCVGRQWLENLATHGKNSINVCILTLEKLLTELSVNEMLRSKLVYADFDHALALLLDICYDIENKCKYLFKFGVNEDIAKAILAAINEVRLAGLGIDDLDEKAFEVKDKCQDIKLIFKEYTTRLAAENIIDYASLLRIAIDKSQNDDKGAVLIYPSDMQFRVLESRLVDSFGNKKCIDVDAFNYKDKPECIKTGHAKLFRASGIRNEIEEIIRRCVNNGISFDDVEIICSESSTYNPVIYEVAKSWVSDDKELKDGLPVTFASGIEVRFTRPSKALLGWLQWIQNGYMQTELQNMLSEKLIKLEDIPGHESASLLSKLPIHFGIGRYNKCIESKIEELTNEEPTGNEKLSKYENLKDQLEGLLELSDIDIKNNNKLLSGACKFLERFASTSCEINEIGKKNLIEAIQVKSKLFQIGDSGNNWSAYTWLHSLATELSICSSGPKPGHIHVSGLFSGGHCGREHIFFVGLDSSRYPGKYIPDPILLDSERQTISEKIRTSKEEFEQKALACYRLLARLRGSITFSYSYIDYNEDRIQQASSLFVDAYRMISNRIDADYTEVEKETLAVSSMLHNPQQALSENEYLLAMLSTGSRELDGNVYAHLKAGITASEKRMSNDFTEYDGNVPQAGKDFDPFNGKTVVSVSSLQTMGGCPLKYFFEKILGIKPPDEYNYDIWLEKKEEGELLHTIFEIFMKTLKGKEQFHPEESRDKKLLREIFESVVSDEIKVRPPASQAVYGHQLAQLWEACHIFLCEEEQYCDDKITPEYFELSIGMYGSNIEPVKMPVGKNIILGCGRIDRVDKFSGSNGSTHWIWDYKTGSSKDYKLTEKEPSIFKKGKHLQHVFYKKLAERYFSRIGKPVNISQVGFFFTSVKGKGERIVFTDEQLKGEGDDVLTKICQSISQGAFCGFMKDDYMDKFSCEYCHYKQICLTCGTTKDTFDSKYTNKENKTLKPFAELKEYEQE